MTARRLGRGVWRVVRPILRWTVRVVVVAVAAALVVLHTDWGRDQVRGVIEDALQARFAGPVHVGRLEGSVFTELVLRDITVDDPGHGRALSIERIEVELALGDLLRKRARRDPGRARGAVWLRQEPGGVNLARLVLPSEPSTWDVRVDRLVVDDAAIEVETAEGEVHHLDRLAVTGMVDLPADESIYTRLAVGGRWRERAAPVVLTAEVAVRGDVVEVPALEVRLDEATLAGAGITVDLRDVGLAAAGTLTAQVPARSLRRLAPGVEVGADLAAELVVTTTTDRADGATTTARVRATFGAASLSGEVHGALDARRVYGELGFTALDLAQLGADAPASSLGGRLTFDGALAGNEAELASLTATASLAMAGQIGALRIDELGLAASLRDRRATVDAHARGPGDARVTLDAEAVVADDGAIELARGRAHGEVADLARASAGLAPAGGALTFDLGARGRLAPTLASVAVTGRVDGRRLRADDLAVARATIEVDVRGPRARPRGDVEVALTGIRRADQRLGALTVHAHGRGDGRIEVAARSRPRGGADFIDAAGVVEVLDDGAAIELGAYRARARGVDVRGRGGRVTITADAVRIADVAARLEGGRLEVDGVLHRAGPRAGSMSGTARVRALSLAAVGRALALDGLRGRIDGRVSLAGTLDAPRGQLDGTVRGLALGPDRPTLDVEVAAKVAPRRATATVAVHGADLGTVELALDVDAPRQVTDPAAWARLERTAIRSGRVQVDDVELAAVGRALGLERTLAGHVEGFLALDPQGSTGTLKVRGVEVGELPGPVDANVELAAGHREDPGGEFVLAADVDAGVGDLGRGAAHAAVALPDRPFDVAGWRRLDRAAIRRVTARSRGRPATARGGAGSSSAGYVTARSPWPST
ncbi:MAG: hypothetical protein R2939_16940 [Kofleriaceae bacterium]